MEVVIYSAAIKKNDILAWIMSFYDCSAVIVGCRDLGLAESQDKL